LEDKKERIIIRQFFGIGQDGLNLVV